MSPIQSLERDIRVERILSVWKTDVLPLTLIPLKGNLLASFYLAFVHQLFGQYPCVVGSRVMNRTSACWVKANGPTIKRNGSNVVSHLGLEPRTSCL